MDMLRIIALLAFMPGLTWAHEVPGWEIENTRGETLRTAITIQSFAGDWCGEEPATLSLICDDTSFSLVFQSNCTPSTTANGRTFVGLFFEGSYHSSEDYIFDVSEDMRTLVLSGGYLFSPMYNFFSYDTVLFTLTEWERPNRDISFDLSNFDGAVRNSGMQCGIQRLFQ
jgi:hypothetical protein